MSKNFNPFPHGFTDRREPYRIEAQRQAHGKFHVLVGGLSLADGLARFNQVVQRMRETRGGHNAATTRVRLVDGQGETIQQVDLARERRRERARRDAEMLRVVGGV